MGSNHDSIRAESCLICAIEWSSTDCFAFISNFLCHFSERFVHGRLKKAILPFYATVIWLTYLSFNICHLVLCHATHYEIQGSKDWYGSVGPAQYTEDVCSEKKNAALHWQDG